MTETYEDLGSCGQNPTTETDGSPRSALERTALPCPFCGAAPPRITDQLSEDGYWVVMCFECKSASAFCADKDRAIERWNTRADPPDIKYRMSMDRNQTF